MNIMKGRDRMGERRTLVEGISPAEKQFVYADARTANVAAPVAQVVAPDLGAGRRPAVGRVPLTTRIRADYAAALKRASLERQLAGVEPNTILDILEEALGPWLTTHGYLP